MSIETSFAVPVRIEYISCACVGLPSFHDKLHQSHITGEYFALSETVRCPWFRWSKVQNNLILATTLRFGQLSFEVWPGIDLGEIEG